MKWKVTTLGKFVDYFESEAKAIRHVCRRYDNIRWVQSGPDKPLYARDKAGFNVAVIERA